MVGKKNNNKRWIVRNWESVLAIVAISISILSLIISGSDLYKQTETRIDCFTYGEVTIYYPENQTSNVKYEKIKITVNNSLEDGLDNIRFLISVHTNELSYANLTLEDYNKYEPFETIGRFEKNTSIHRVLRWEGQASRDTWIAWYNLTWDATQHPDLINYSEIDIEMHLNKKLVPITKKLQRQKNESYTIVISNGYNPTVPCYILRSSESMISPILNLHF